MSDRPTLAALFNARDALRLTGAVGPGSPLTGQAHPYTLEALLREAYPGPYAPVTWHVGDAVMGIPFTPDAQLAPGVLIVERAPFVDRYEHGGPLPEHLRGVLIERVHTLRVTVRA